MKFNAAALVATVALASSGADAWRIRFYDLPNQNDALGLSTPFFDFSGFTTTLCTPLLIPIVQNDQAESLNWERPTFPSEEAFKITVYDRDDCNASGTGASQTYTTSTAPGTLPAALVNTISSFRVDNL